MYKYNDKIESLSKEQKEVILRNENSKNLEKLKKKRNNIQKAIKREQKQINKEEIENATNKIFSSKHGYKFFKAI